MTRCATGIGARAGARFGGQPGRPEQRADRAQWAGSAGGAACGAGVARVQPAEIDYVEAHGTGTALGDPIELEALNQVFPDRDRAAPLVLGSVKTNLGHLENSAGIAGFIKTVLSLDHGYIPPHLHFKQLTPNASAGASRFTIAAQGMQWPAVGRPRRAGVSSFGVSGTNAHVVLEQAPAPESVAAQPEPVVSTLVISGKTPERIAPIAAMLADWMDGEGAAVPLADVAHTLNHHRARFKSFAAVCARDRTQAVAGLRALAAGEPAAGVVEQREGPHGRARCSCTRVRARSGRAWASGCWPMSRRLLRRLTSWSRLLLRRSGFRCGMCWLPGRRWWVSSVFSRCWWACSWR